MPVSAALLLTNPAGSGVGNMSAQPHFVRGDKTTSSVKLRRRKDEVPGGGGGQRPGKKNRHSGDFSFFSSKRMEVHYMDAVNKQHGDFDYITFPNGVPCVKELRVAAPNGQPGSLVVGPEPHSSVQVTVQDNGRTANNLRSAKGVSSSAFNITENGYRPQNFHQDVRRRNHTRSHSQQPGKHSNRQTDSPHRQTDSPSRQTDRHANSPSRPLSEAHNLRSLHSQSSYFPSTKDDFFPSPVRSHKVENSPGRNNRNVTKTCVNEFEFRRVNKAGDNLHIEEQAFMEKMINKEFLADSGSQESGIFSTGSSQESPRKQQARQPGLGRRAITQVNLKDNRGRKNSYSNALARSQENLVKAVDAGADDDDVEVGKDDDRSYLREEDGSFLREDAPDEATTLKKGLLWQQRDKLFSRWKERYFILTKDFLQCFKKETSKITEMGGFIFKIKLSEVESIDLLDKRGYLTICINLVREAKVFLRKTEGIREWYTCLRDCIKDSKNRKSNRSSAIFLDRKQTTDSSGMEIWAMQRRLKYGRSDSTPEVNKVGAKERITLDELSSLYKNEEEQEKKQEQDRIRKRINRLSLMTDVDLPDLTGGSGDLDLDKNYLRKKTDSDSGHNSLNTNRSNTSTGSSKLSGPIESSFLEEEEDDDILEEDIRTTQGPRDMRTSDGPRSLYEGPREKQVPEGPRSLYEGGKASSSSSHVESVTISCSLPSPQIKISKQPHSNKNVIEVRYRERNREGGHNSPRPSGQPKNRQSDHVNRLQITHV